LRTAAAITEPTPELEDAGGATSVAYIPKGLTVVVLRPFPWEAATQPSAALKLAGLESLLVILAAIGLLVAISVSSPSPSSCSGPQR
jgi:hypothetical protein